MPPLIIWGVAIGAEELLTLTGVLAATAVVTNQQQSRGGSLASSLSSATQACSTCDPPPEVRCKQLREGIQSRQNELSKRYAEMREDKLGLYGLGAQGLPGAGNWQGHIDQFVAKQRNLRKMLNDHASSGCGQAPDDAWKAATRDAPTQPAPR